MTTKKTIGKNRRKARVQTSIEPDIYEGIRKSKYTFGELIEWAWKQKRSRRTEIDDLMREIEYYQKQIDVRMDRINDLRKLEEEREQDIWDEMLSLFKRSYRSHGEINEDAILFWSQQLGVSRAVVEDVVEREVVDPIGSKPILKYDIM